MAVCVYTKMSFYCLMFGTTYSALIKSTLDYDTSDSDESVWEKCHHNPLAVSETNSRLDRTSCQLQECFFMTEMEMTRIKLTLPIGEWKSCPT